MTRQRTFWIVLSLGALGLLGLALRPRAVRVDAAPVSRGPLRITIDEEGRTQVKRRYLVSAPLTGKLLRIELKAGDRVNEGAVLGRLVPADAPLLDPRARAEQQARLHASEAAVEQASANVLRAQAAEATARDDLARKHQLGSGITEREMVAAENDATARAQDVTSAQFGAKVAQHQLAESRAALQRGRSGRLDEFEIVAPTSGQVLRVLKESEGVVAAGTPLIEVGDPSVLEVAAELLTNEAVRVQPGMPAFIDHWGGTSALAARVESVEPSGFTKVSALGVEEQRVRVILELTAPPAEWRELGDNYRVEVHIVAWQADSVLRAPTAGLFRRGDAWAAFAVDEGRLRERQLEVGEQSPVNVEVRGGLREGELVVVRPGESLREGMRAEAVVP